MTSIPISSAIRGHNSVSLVLFLCLFAAQAGAIALSPVLADVARDLHVSTATAGQLRTIAGLVAGVTALTLARLRVRATLRRQLLEGSMLLAIGSVASAAAPDIAVLAAAQVPVGAGIGILTSVGTLAAAEWVPPERRTQTLSSALIGQPTAWIVGMPLLGAVGDRSWRWGWLVLPLGAALVAAAALARRHDGRRAPGPPARLRGVLASDRLGRWLAAEALANTAWAGTLVYSGALLAESYRASTEVTGVALALGAGAYVAGNLTARRITRHEPWQLLAGFGIALAAATALLGAFRPSLATSTALFSAAAFAAGARMVVSGAIAVAAPPELRPGAMAMRAASIQLGYFAGSFAAGLALTLGGYSALGGTLGAIFLAAAVVAARGVPTPSSRLGDRRRRVVASRPVAWSFGCSARWR